MITFSEVVQKKLKKAGVAVVYLIGSQAEGLARQDSDTDFGIVMADPKAKASLMKKEHAELHQTLYEILEKTIPHSNLDIIFLDTAPLYYSIAARDRGKVLFEIDPQFRARFEEKITLEYADFEPLRREQEEVTLKMI